MRVEAEHGRDQVLELLVEEVFLLPVGVGSPELARLVCGNKLVVRVLHVGHIEGRVTGIHDEQDAAKGKQVDDLSLVGLACMDLRSHEAEGAYDTAVDAGAITALNRTGETKVDNLDVIILVKQHILALEVAMSEAASMDVVNSLDELLSVVAGDAFSEWPRVGNKVEELTAWHKLTNDVGNLDLLAVLLVPHSVLVELEILEHVLVRQHVD